MATNNWPKGISNHLKIWIDTIRVSYWFLPACMTLLALVCCFSCMYFVTNFDVPKRLIAMLPSMGIEGSRQLISTIAGAIITVTSIAFSMTIVALTLASSQLGPRLIRTFLEDRGTQYVLGMMVSTFNFCLVALYFIESIEENPLAISTFSSFALVLAIIDMGAIVYFIHHVCTSIQADRVIHRCYQEFVNSLPELLPDPMLASHHKAVAPELLETNDYATDICSTHSGYIQSINYDGFLAVEIKEVSGIELHLRGGDHVVCGQKLFTVHSGRIFGDKELEDLRASISIGDCRTPIQDPEFSVSQLVEIALRALSPGINDPYTAKTCLDRLTSACLDCSQRPFPPPAVINSETGLWLKRRCFNLESILDTAYIQIRQAAISHPAIIIHLLDCLGTLKREMNDSYQDWLSTQLDAIQEQVEQQSFVQSDKRAIEQAIALVN